MSDFRFSHPVQVRFQDCDMMGHVNNAVYLTYIEQSRVAYWREVIGERQADDDVFFILARAECDYRLPIMLNDQVVVRIRAGAVGRSSFTFEYQLVDPGDGRVFADARTVQVMYDYQVRKSVPVTEAIRAKLERHEGRSLSSPRRQ